MGETEQAAAWGIWLSEQLESRGWRQADLVNNSGGRIKRDRASKWVRGAESPTHRMAVVVANTLEVSRADALRAAGYEPAAEEAELAERELKLVRALAQVDAQLDEGPLPSTPDRPTRVMMMRMLDQLPPSAILDYLTRRAIRDETRADVAPSTEDESHTVDLSEDLDLAATEDDTAPDPERQA